MNRLMATVGSRDLPKETSIDRNAPNHCKSSFASSADVAGMLGLEVDPPQGSRRHIEENLQESVLFNIRAPLLFFHRDRDEIIPLKLGRSLFEAALEPKWFIDIPGAGHNDLVETAGSSYRERLHEFYGHLQ
jgi:fermentation-respiration switch protein FrsA (DUF1100 family)